MGQAKQRGTFEQRKLEAQHTEALRMESRRLEIEATKERRRQHDLANPVQAEKRRRASRNLNTIITIMAASTLLGRN